MIEKLNSPYIHDANSDNFKELVLENSHRGPVLVNFCSGTDDSCLHQSPMLEQLIHHYDGRVLLINMDTEDEFVFTKEYGITSVPTLKLFRHGQVVETMHGYQSESDLKQVLEQYVVHDSDLKLADAIDLFTHGQARAAYEMIAELIGEDPLNPRLPLTMCKLLRHEGRYQEAIKLIASLPTDIRGNKDIQQIAAQMSFFVELESVPEPDTLPARHKASADDLKITRQLVAYRVTQQQYEQALQLLAEIIETEPSFEENYAQQAMLKVFEILGDAHPLVGRFRACLRRYIH